MIKTLGLVAALYCLAILCSCQKEIASTPGTTDTTDTTTSAYMPLTSGTYWVYKDSASGAYDTVTVVTGDTTINNLSFTKVHTTGALGQSDSYYTINNHNYYLTGTQNGITLTMLVLNDTASVGSSWTEDLGTISGISARGIGTIIKKLDSYVVNGVTFSNVIHSRFTLSYNVVGTYSDFGTYDFYFAKGKGIIKLTSKVIDITSGNDTISTQELVDYSIK